MKKMISVEVDGVIMAQAETEEDARIYGSFVPVLKKMKLPFFVACL